MLNSFISELNVVIIGASGGLGKAFIEILEQDSKVASIHAFSRREVSGNSEKTSYLYIDLENENSYLVGDSDSDISTGNEMGLITVKVNNEYTLAKWSEELLSVIE